MKGRVTEKGRKWFTPHIAVRAGTGSCCSQGSGSPCRAPLGVQAPPSRPPRASAVLGQLGLLGGASFGGSSLACGPGAALCCFMPLHRTEERCTFCSMEVLRTAVDEICETTPRFLLVGLESLVVFACLLLCFMLRQWQMWAFI